MKIRRTSVALHTHTHVRCISVGIQIKIILGNETRPTYFKKKKDKKRKRKLYKNVHNACECERDVVQRKMMQRTINTYVHT